MRKLRVLQLCPLWFPIAHDTMGGIETLLVQLVEELSDRPCEITIIASGDSHTAARLIAASDTSIYKAMHSGRAQEYVFYEQRQLQLALRDAQHFDLIHSHIGPAALALSGLPQLAPRILHTIHSPIYKDMQWFAEKNPNFFFSTVSQFQAQKLLQRGAEHCYVIPNGIKMNHFTFNPAPSSKLVFLGRIEHAKGPDLAISVAQSLNMPLTLAGPIVEQGYFEQSIKPFLGDTIRYIGTVDHRQKNKLLGDALCLLMPSRWDEPFGIVAIEAMACGTPVVALARGALPEIIKQSVTGYLCKDEIELAPSVNKCQALRRDQIRGRASMRFEIATIAQQYYELYVQMIERCELKPNGLN